MASPLTLSRPTATTSANRRRTAATAMATLLVATVLTGCLPSRVAVAGRRCTGSGLARNATYILQCKRGRWTRTITIKVFLAREQAAQAAAAAKAAADAARAAAAAAEWARATGVNERAAALRGIGAWVDVYDWSPTFISSRSPGSTPSFTLSRIDRMADNGVNTMYIQTAKAEFSEPLLDPALLVSIIAKAKSRGIRVIGWYLPTFGDPAVDQAHIAATIAAGVDGFGLDIESTSTELTLRNQRLIELSAWMRSTYPNEALAAIVLPPVVTDVINLNYWPNFPWAQIATSYDVWMPMAYWTNRRSDSVWRDAYRYTWENIDRIRTHLAMPAAVVNPIGGLSDTTTTADIDGFLRAANERGAIGGGLYDDGITTAAQYQQLAPLSRP